MHIFWMRFIVFDSTNYLYSLLSMLIEMIECSFVESISIFGLCVSLFILEYGHSNLFLSSFFFLYLFIYKSKTLTLFCIF